MHVQKHWCVCVCVCVCGGGSRELGRSLLEVCRPFLDMFTRATHLQEGWVGCAKTTGRLGLRVATCTRAPRQAPQGPQHMQQTRAYRVDFRGRHAVGQIRDHTPRGEQHVPILGRQTWLRFFGVWLLAAAVAAVSTPTKSARAQSAEARMSGWE